MKPFNLEAVKAGKPFQFISNRGHPKYAKLSFVGVCKNGEIAYEISYTKEEYRNKYLYSAPECEFEMFPEKKVFKGLLIGDPPDCKRRLQPFLRQDTIENRKCYLDGGFEILKEFEIEYEDES